MITSIKKGKEFCYFPGKIVLEKFMIGNLIANQNLTKLAIENFDSFKTCNCK